MQIEGKAGKGLVIFVSLVVLYFCSIFHRVGIAAISSDLQLDFNTSASILGLMSSMYFYSYAVAQIPAGLMTDKIGVRKTLAAFGLIAVLGNLLFSLSLNIDFLSVGRALIGFGVGGFYVCCLKALALNYSRRRYATMTGILTSLGNIGAIAASSPLALISLVLGWREAFLIILVVMIVFVGLYWFNIKDEQTKEAAIKRSMLRDLKTVFSNREILKLAPVPFFVYGFFVSFQGLWVSPFLMDIYSMSKTTASFFFMLISIGFVIAFPLAGVVSDRIKRRKPILLAGIVMSILFWLLMSFFGGALDSYQIAALLFFLGFSFGVADIFLTIPVNLCPIEIAGLAIAGVNIFNFVGGGFFQYFMGFVLDSTRQFNNILLSYQIIFGIATFCIFIALISSMRLDERKCG